MFNQDIDYLKDKEIGGVISKGLAETFLKKPERPVEFLAKYLLNYVENEKENQKKIQENEKFQQIKKEIVFQDQETQKIQEQQQQEKQREIDEEFQFYDNILKVHYFEDMMNPAFFEKIKKIYELNAVSIGIYEKSLKFQDLEQNEDILAHYDNTNDIKVIRFVGSDQQEIYQQILPQDQSSIYELFEIVENEDQENQEQQQVKKEFCFQKYSEISQEMIDCFKDFQYIPDVIKTDKDVFFFGIPKFGSQFSSKFQIECFDNDKSFDECLNKQNEFLQKQQEQNELKEKDEQEYQQKLQELQEKGDDTTELEQEKQNFVYEKIILQKPIFEQKDYILIFDNLGKDETFSEEQILKLKKFIIFFQNKLNTQNLESIRKNISMYISLSEKYSQETFIEQEEEILNQIQDYEKDLEESLTKMTQNLIDQKIDDSVLDINYVRQINASENYKQNEYHEYYLQEFKTNIYLNNLLENKEKIQEFFELKYSKFQRLFQLVYYLLGYKKNEFNLENTNIFNWRNFKEEKQYQFFEEIEKYQYKGYKTNEIQQYNRIDQIEKFLEQIDQEQVKNYSYPFYMIYRVLNNLIKLRIQDIKKRREEIKIFETIRQKRLEMKQKREEIMKQELELAKQEFYSNFDQQQKEEEEDKQEDQNEDNEEQKQEEEKEQLEFDEKEWNLQWTEQNPEIIIPQELNLPQDIDISEDYFQQEENDEGNKQQFQQKYFQQNQRIFFKYILQ